MKQHMADELKEMAEGKVLDFQVSGKLVKDGYKHLVLRLSASLSSTVRSACYWK
jgi:hypothetical protein